MIRHGDILLYSGDSFISCMIRAVTEAPWSHAAWVLNEKKILEADWPKVMISPIDKYPKEKCKIVRIQGMGEELIGEIVEEALKKVGNWYDVKQFISLFFLYCRGKRFRKSAREWESAYICSELIAEPCWTVARFKFRPDIPVENIVPGDIDQSISTTDIKHSIS